MKVLLDTNVLIAAFISSQGRCAELLEHCAQAHELVTSDALLDEYHEKLVKKFRLPPDAADARICFVRRWKSCSLPPSPPPSAAIRTMTRYSRPP